MAKKTQRKTDKASTKSAAPPPVHHAILAASLKRALSCVESLPGAKDPLPEGGYPVVLNMDIVGDVTVGAAKEGGMALDFSTADLLNSLLSVIKPKDRAGYIEQALEQIKTARKDKVTAALIKDAGKAATVTIEGHAKKLRLRKRKAGARGAVSGKPKIAVRGQADIATIEIVLDGDASEARDAA